MKFLFNYIPLMYCDSSSKGKTEGGGGNNVNVSNVAESSPQPEETPQQKALDALKKNTNEATIANYVNALGGEVRVRTRAPWNCRIESFYVYNGNLFASIYWQGDSTDGSESVRFSKIVNGGHVIPAETFFDGYRTRTTHSDLRITKEMVTDAIEALKKA